MRIRHALLAVLTGLVLALSGCASQEKGSQQRQVASMLAYLYPGSQQPPPASNEVAVIKVPFRIGVAFVPDNADPVFRLPESERLKLAGQVRDAFSGYPFVSEIVPVPSVYLESGGSFSNLDRIAALLRLDVIALVSYDQVQHANASEWSILYWTLIGAYIVPGDRYDILTAVEVAVFDVKSRQLLMRASGTSNVKGAASWVGFAERSREARTQGFEQAVSDMIPKLHAEVQAFRERAPRDPRIRLELPPGYNPGALKPPLPRPAPAQSK